MADQDRTARPTAAVVQQRVDVAQLERRIAELGEALVLGPGVTRWATVRLEGDAEPVMTVNAMAGGVRVGRAVPLPAALRQALIELMDDAEDATRADLKRALSHTLASSEINLGGGR